MMKLRLSADPILEYTKRKRTFLSFYMHPLLKERRLPAQIDELLREDAHIRFERRSEQAYQLIALWLLGEPMRWDSVM